MACLIRSARLADEPRQLHLREQPLPAPPMPTLNPEAPILEPRPADEPSSRQYEEWPTSALDQIFVAASSDSRSSETLQPALDPETEIRLLKEAHEAREIAEALGREEGYKKGLAEAQQTLQEQIEAVRQLYESASQALKTQVNGLEDIVVALAFEAVCRIIGSCLHNRDGVIAVVRETLAHVKDSEPITVRVAPGDYRLLAHDQSVLTKGFLGPTITLVADDRVVLGGCLIETSGGSLDGRLETQLQQFKDALLSAKRQHPEWKGGDHDV